MQVSTTAEFEWESRGDMRSANMVASEISCGIYDIRASRIYVCPHLQVVSFDAGFHTKVSTDSEQSGNIDTIFDALL